MNAYQDQKLQQSSNQGPASPVEGFLAFFDGLETLRKNPRTVVASPFVPLAPPWLSQTSHENTQQPKRRLPAAICEENLEKQILDFTKQEALLKEVRQHYVLPADSSVLYFLTAHRNIPQILLGAVSHLKACFGLNAVFNLRAPIDDSGIRTLYAVAMWPGKLNDVRTALEKFDDQWWIANSPQAAGYLVFTYELV
jgi:hypothetical protein